MSSSAHPTPSQWAANSSFSFQVLSEAFEAFKADWKPFIFFPLSVLAPMTVGYGIYMVGFFPMYFSAMNGASSNLSMQNLAPILIGSGILGLLTLVLICGLLRMSYIRLDTGEVQWTEGWRCWAQLPGQLFILVTLGLLHVVGSIALIVPGLLAAAALWLAAPIYADPRHGRVLPFEAVKESWRLCKPNLLMSFLFVTVIFLAQQAGASVMGIGFVVTAPICAIAAAMTKRRQEAICQALEAPQ